MGLTSLSVLLAVVLLNVHLYGSALKPVPCRLRRILFFHVAPILRVKLHRSTTVNDQKTTQRTSTTAPRRSTTIYNAVFLNETDLSANSQQSASHTLNSTTMTANNVAATNSNSDSRNEPLLSSSASNVQSTPQTLQECKRLLGELNRLILRPSETSEEDIIIRDWQNVALVIDRSLFYVYLLLTTLLTASTLLLAPLLKTVPTPPDYFRVNITRE
jgi:nicotinic acetylcholine receptor